MSNSNSPNRGNLLKRMRRAKRNIFRRLGEWRRNAWSLLTAPFRIVWSIITWPFLTTWIWFSRGWQQRRRRDLIFGLPALIALMAVGGLAAEAWLKTRSINDKYLKKANEAVDRKDYHAAEVLLQRILSHSHTNVTQAEFTLGEVFEETDRKQRAQWLFQKLAPNDEAGHPPAHKKRAVALAELITSKSQTEEIRNLRWHLSYADGKRTPTLARAWAAYYLALNQVEPAIAKLEMASSEYPELKLLLGKLYLDRQEVEAAKASYRTASNFLRSRLKRDPGNSAIRVTFANTLLKIGELNECEAVLAVGLKLDPNGPYKVLLASLYTNRHDMAVRQEEDVSISKLLKFLHVALNYDPHFTPAYERLVSYGNAKVKGKENLTEILNEVIAQGEEPGLAHFSMSILKLKEKETKTAVWHLERAHRLLPKMPFIANNLAWILATEPPVDLDRALLLIQPALKTFPEEPRLLDTRATILIKLKRWDEAFDDLERALRNQRNPDAQTELHKKLAIVCEQLNQPGLAKKHRELANKTILKPKIKP